MIRVYVNAKNTISKFIIALAISLILLLQNTLGCQLFKIDNPILVLYHFIKC
ncbi:MAG: hypothetical protein K0R50_3985 [Eubacterium sp.]|jgi:hypothetical protein|nr:hypothetical protein [Eubacterium sp.]